MSNIIQTFRSGGSSKLTCNICGNGTSHYRHGIFGNVWGESCDSENFLESSYTCEKENSACITIENISGEGRIAQYKDYEKWLLENRNQTYKERSIFVQENNT